MIVKAEGPSDFEDFGGGGLSYTAENTARRKKRRMGRWKMNRLRRQAKLEELSRRRSMKSSPRFLRTGMQSLTWQERRTLKLRHRAPAATRAGALPRSS